MDETVGEDLFLDLLGQEDAPGPSAESHAQLRAHLNELLSQEKQVRFDQHLTEFQEDISEEALLIGAVHTDDIVLEEERLAQEQQQLHRLRADQFRSRRDGVRERRRQALAHSARAHTDRMNSEKDLERRRTELFKTQGKAISSAFGKAERQLVAALKQREADMENLYGPFRIVDENRATDKLDWNSKPHRVRLTVKMLRAVRDKLPHGKYVVLCSVFDHLGGHAVPMSAMRRMGIFSPRGDTESLKATQCEQTVEINFPDDPSAINCTVEMHFDSELHFVCPAKDIVRPSMVFLFEVVLRAATDVVVGWGVFPLCDSRFDIVRGSFKTPLLRGPVDLSIDKHLAFTQRLTEDIDRWLVNLYFEVMPEDRIAPDGRREHEWELAHTSRLLGNPRRDIGMPQLTYRPSEHADSDSDDEEIGMRAAPLTLGQELEKYRFSVGDQEGYREHSEMWRKLQYMKREALTELGLSNWRTLEFYGALFFLVFSYWFRMYVHYVGQWLMSQMLRIPVFVFEFRWYTVIIDYTPWTLPVGYEALMVIAGPIFCIMWFMLFMLVAYLSQKLTAVFPEMASRFIMAYGLMVLLDPFLILINDLAATRWSGDPFKLYQRMYFAEGTGAAAVGVILTVLIYIGTMVIAAFLVYRYVLHMHLNGRMLDTYHRIMGEESAFFVPQDLELSLNELRWICERAERWRGANGERRKTFVFEVEVTDPRDPQFRERTTHVGIFELDRNIRKRPHVHRHLLRLPEGHIVEVLKDPKRGLLLGSDDTRHLMTRNHRVLSVDIGEVGNILERNF